MSYTAHSHFWLFTILDFIKGISWIYFFSLKHANNYFLFGKPGPYQFLGHSSILSEQPAALSFALGLCWQTPCISCVVLTTASLHPLFLLLFYICSRGRRLQRNSACISQSLVLFLVSQMTFLPMFWVILIISQTVFLLLERSTHQWHLPQHTVAHQKWHAFVLSVKKETSAKKEILHPNSLIKCSDLHIVLLCLCFSDKILFKQSLYLLIIFSY